MNNKGFTLIEMLAVIVIISVLGVIAYMSVNSYIETSKDKAEEKFLTEISNQIDSYISLNSDKFISVSCGNGDEFYTITKDYSLGNTNWGDSSDVKVECMQLNGGVFTLGVLKDGLGTTDSFVNPRNDKKCNLDNTVINVYKDEDFVYYYNVDFSNSNCGVEESIDTSCDDDSKYVSCSDEFKIDTRVSSLKIEMGDYISNE